jgi:hypothetical protein
VTHLEVTPQNVKQPKTGRNSGHVRNSDKYGTFLRLMFDVINPSIYILRIG